MAAHATDLKRRIHPNAPANKCLGHLALAPDSTCKCGA